jgi:hypothetical protein
MALFAFATGRACPVSLSHPWLGCALPLVLGFLTYMGGKALLAEVLPARCGDVGLALALNCLGPPWCTASSAQSPDSRFLDFR